MGYSNYDDNGDDGVGDDDDDVGCDFIEHHQY